MADNARMSSAILLINLFMVPRGKTGQKWNEKKYTWFSKVFWFPFFEQQIQTTAAHWCGKLLPLTRVQNAHAGC